MKLLAIETSTRRLSVALWADGKCNERARDIPNGGSEVLLPWVAELLAASELSLAQMDGIAFGAGPGGFTGLRLACGIVQGLAFGIDRPVIGIGSLAVLARVAFEQTGATKILTCIDARMNEVYSAAWKISDGVPVAVLAPAVSAPQNVALPDDHDWLGCGDGFAAYATLPQVGEDQTLAAIRNDLYPTASALAELAAPRLARGEGTDAAQAIPLYVRDKVALTTAERLARGGLR